jgi:hypothetical protein
MKCCINCFKDSAIREIIHLYGTKGDCDFCSSKNTDVYDISKSSNMISDKITSLIQIYSPSEHSDARFLKEILRDDWDVFSGGSEGIKALLEALCLFDSDLDIDKEILVKKVAIEKLHDIDYINEYGVVRGLSWTDFSESIKHTNRFFSSNFNADVFSSFLTMVQKTYEEGTSFYRARISPNSNGFEKEEMFAPPIGKRTAGRVNPDGIGVLYLSTDDKTVLNETRVTAYDYVTIGTFKNKKPIKVANISEISRVSPFLYNDEFERFALNRKVFQEMAYEIAKPIRRNDSPLEYLPTQYIAEFVKSEGYDGVEYESTLRKGGINLALFDESLVECVNVKTIEITSVEYNIQE